MWLEFTLQMAVMGHTTECQMMVIWLLCKNIFVLSSYRQECQELSESRRPRYLVMWYFRVQRVFLSIVHSYHINREQTSFHFWVVSWAFDKDAEKNCYIFAWFLCARHHVNTPNTPYLPTTNACELFGTSPATSLSWDGLSVTDTCFILIIWLIRLTFWISFLVLTLHMISLSCT